MFGCLFGHNWTRWMLIRRHANVAIYQRSCKECGVTQTTRRTTV